MFCRSCNRRLGYLIQKQHRSFIDMKTASHNHTDTRDTSVPISLQQTDPVHVTTGSASRYMDTKVFSLLACYIDPQIRITSTNGNTRHVRAIVPVHRLWICYLDALPYSGTAVIFPQNGDVHVSSKTRPDQELVWCAQTSNSSTDSRTPGLFQEFDRPLP